MGTPPDQQGLLNSLDRVSALEEAALKLESPSPYLRSLAVFMHWEKADALIRLGKPEGVLAEREAAVAQAREIVKRSPDVEWYAGLLADSLTKLGTEFRRLQRTADARAAFEEGNQIMDGLVRRFPDRGNVASAWVDRRTDLADFFEYGPKPQGEIQAKQDLLRTLDQAVQRGREFAERFPDHHWLQYNFAKSLASRGRYDSEAKRHEQALPYLLEAAEVYRTRLLPETDPPGADDVTTYLEDLGLASECAGSFGNGDEVIRLSQLALQVRPHCQGRRAADHLGTVLATAAKVHRDAGRNAEAIQMEQQAIEVRRPEFEKATWDWYLRSNIGASYMHLADTYRQTQDFRNEVLANREFLKLIIGPLDGAKIEDYIDPSRPADEAEANRIRELIKQATASGMKRFTVPCDFNGVKYPFHVYVSNVHWPKHPLEDQARWLWEERGGTIPKEVMESFERLHKIAHENNVSFVDLCVYALGTAVKEGKSLVIENIGEPSVPVGSSEMTTEAAPESFGDLKAQLADLKTRLDNAPNDLGVAGDAALAYEELGWRLLKAKQPREGAEALREAVRLCEMLTRAQPAVARHRQLLAATFLLLGKAHVQLKEFDATYDCLHRRLDLLEQFQLDAPSPERRSAIAESLVLFGELAELRGDRAGALRWYARAVQQKSSHGPSNIANLLQLDPALRSLLPMDLQAVYNRMTKEGRSTATPAFVLDFAKEVEDLQKARESQAVLGSGASTNLDKRAQIHSLTDFAESHRALAAEYLKQSKGEEALTAYLEEVKLRGLVVRLDSFAQAASDNYARALLDAGKVSIDLGKTADGIKLLERAEKLDDEKATFFLAQLYEQGKGVSRDVKKAASMRSNFTFNKGWRLYDQKKYAEALVEFERSVKEKPSIGGYQGVGWCQRKLGRNQEAIAALKKAIELAPGLNNCVWVVLDLGETALSANKPEEVFAALRLMEDKKWSVEGTDIPHTLERELTGMRAIALHMADKDASEAEKKLEEIVSRPNLSSLRSSRNVELDAWLKDSRPSYARQAAVKKIIATLDAPARTLSEPYYPLKKGRTWVYKTSSGGEVSIRAARSEKVGERAYWLLETVVNGKVIESERIAVESDGVYRQSSILPLLKPHMRILPLPARGGDSWAIKSRMGSSADVTGEGATRVEDVTVRAGEFKGAIVTELKTRDAGGERVQTIWYAKDIGPVKIVTKTKKTGALVWELDRVVTISYSCPFA